MTNTRDKLNEAKYFLEEMRRVSSSVNQFRYEFTAFLAASRSITQIMQEEFSERPGFCDWYALKQTEMRNHPILKYLHKQREITYHKRPVLQYPIGVTDQITDGMGLSIILAGTGSNLEIHSHLMNPPIIGSASSVKYYFSDITDNKKDIITICQEAVNTIESIVNECESKFCANA